MPSPQEYQAQDEAFSKQFAEQQAQKAQETAQAGQPQTFLQKWTAPVGRVTTQILDNAVSGAQLIYDTPGMKKARDVASGAITGVTNIADTVVKGANKAAELLQPAAEAQRDLGMGAAPQPVIPEPIWDHAKQHIMDFRDAVQVQDPTLSDNLTQSVAQLAIPFAGYSRALSGLHWVAQAATAGALTDATALGPHDARMADMLALGRHTEGKFGEVLRTIAPDGSALNAYINYLHDRTNETEAEGRFKNVLDGFGVNMVATPLLHSVGMLLKQGTAGLRYMVDNGVPSSGGLVPPQMQRGAVGDLGANGRPPLRQMAGDPAESLYEQQVRDDMERAAANPTGKRPPLRQMAGDPADSIYHEQVRQDMIGSDAGNKENQFAQSTLNSAPSVDSFRRVLQSRAGEVPSSSLDIGKPGTARVADFAKTAGVLIKNLPDDGGEGSFYKDVLQRVVAKNPNATFRVANGPHPQKYAGAYNPSVEDVRLYPSAFQNNGQLVHTFAHEAVHAAVWHDIATNDTTREVLDQLRRAIKEPIDAHNNAIMDARRSGATGTGQLKEEHYGTTDVQEFVAEAESNPKFREVMKSTPTEGGKSVWDNYKEAIGGILGLSGVALASPLFDKLLVKDKEKPGA